jgi:beta-galactosidase
MNAIKAAKSVVLVTSLAGAACGDDPPRPGASLVAQPRAGDDASPAGAPEAADAGDSFAAEPRELRTIEPLMSGWRFVQDDDLSDQDALRDPGTDWEKISLPHTWNADDAASLRAEGYERGRGFYRLGFATPSAGARHYLEIGAASLVAELWLNGEKLGEHRGGFTQFRFDVTDDLAEAGSNEILIKVDNSAPRDEDDPTAIDPLGGDFNVSGGLYRHVALISTPAAAHFSLDDLGGTGVYATTTAIGEGSAELDVRSKLSNQGEAGDFSVRIALIDSAGHVAGSAEAPLRLESNDTGELSQRLTIPAARLWQGTSDPYLYQLVAELVGPDGEPIDRVTQSFGIRQLRFDPNEGLFLNGRRVRLNGVAMHQDFLGKAWAISEADMDASLALIQELGANAIRFGHYPFSDYAHQRASELGMIVWAEKPSGLRTTVDDCTADPTDRYMANARQQLQELIRQKFNFAAVALWSIGNETEANQLTCPEPHDNVTPYLRELHELAKQEDPSRATVNAEFSEGGAAFGEVPFHMGGIADVLGTNRYFLWYDLDFEGLGPLLDRIHAEHPEQPLGVSEYGAGAALTHHTDDPQGGVPEVRSAEEGEVSLQPEEYGAYVHEQVYGVLSSKPFLYGTFVWNMFDFGSDHRNEGDVLGVNTKGLVTFDRQTRKDGFFFYKANWSSEPTTYIAGRRYTERAYGVVDVKVYSNAESVTLSVNAKPFASLTADQCRQRTCVFDDVPLALGLNTLSASGDHADQTLTDSVEWSLESQEFNIAAGRLASGFVSSADTRFGSDAFFVGGDAGYIERDEPVRGGPPEDVDGTDDPTLYKYFREGVFAYHIPLADGRYDVTLGFLEPDDDVAISERVFDVSANGAVQLESFDVRAEAGAAREVVTRSFTLDVTGGRLVLEFDPTEGEAIVSTLKIRPSVTQP